MSVASTSVAFNPWNLKRYRKNNFTGNKILLKADSIKYASQSWTLVVGFFKCTIWKCENRIFCKVFPHVRWCKFVMKTVRYCFCLLIMHYDDNSFFQKNVDQLMRYKVEVKFMYQLHPIMLPKISQISLQ